MEQLSFKSRMARRKLKTNLSLLSSAVVRISSELNQVKTNNNNYQKPKKLIIFTILLIFILFLLISCFAFINFVNWKPFVLKIHNIAMM